MSQDREFDTYINGKSGLSDLYAGLPPVEPPSRLDAAILAEAHRAVGARPGGARKRRWVMPLSLAASLFAAVMIGLQLPHLLKEPAVRPLAAQDRAAAETKDLAAAPAPLAEAQKPAPLASKKRAASPAVSVAPAGAAAPASPPASAAKAFEAAPAAPAPAEASAEQELTARRAVEADRESRSKQERSVLYPESNAGVARPVPPPAAAQAAAPEPAPAAAAAPALESARESDGVASPRDWLARIRQLRQQGKLDEAGKELAAFRKRYPDYPIPKGLEQ